MAIKTLGTDESAEGAIMAEINITPLVDVFLVLLIIFMVTSSVMSQLGVNVTLPQASQATAQAQPDGAVVTLLPDGGLQVGGKGIAPGDYARFEAALRAEFGKMSARLVILDGDRKALLGSAIEVMDSARKAGAEKFAIATAPEPPAGKR
jgi:biopolymer transport protein ExbD